MLEGFVARETIRDSKHEVIEYLQTRLSNIALLFKTIWLVGLVHYWGLRLRVVDRRFAGSGYERLSG
jgi:succinate dehydrogenase hydrophobic anchor subunit